MSAFQLVSTPPGEAGRLVSISALQPVSFRLREFWLTG
jgi:hypothetical protein